MKRDTLALVAIILGVFASGLAIARHFAQKEHRKIQREIAKKQLEKLEQEG